MTPSPPLSAPPAVSLRQDARTIGLVGLAHGASHFFHLLLPPLFPWLIAEFGFSYSELGLLVSVFFVISGVGQALSGFVVDRLGARPILFGALLCFALAGMVAGMAQGYDGLLLASALAGLGNAPFHPVDFTILNKRISPQRLGHAFSVHGIAGNLGWAAAPVYMMGITTLTGSWRTAALCSAALALLVLAVLVLNRDALDDGHGASAAASPGAAVGAPEHALAFLRLPSVWLCFSFFFWTTCALSVIQSFASPALRQMYGLTLSQTSMVVTGYMLCSAAGMVVGGFLVGRVVRLERLISACLLAAGAMLVVVGWGVLPGAGAMALTALAGIGSGLAGPSRDMLIKHAAPPGATGHVYGTVYSGLDLGFAVSAPVFGALLDRGMVPSIFYGAAATLVLGVVSAAWVGAGVAARTPRSAISVAGKSA